MSAGEPLFEKSRSVAHMQDLRLAAQECQVHWRWKTLVDTQRVLEKREILRWLRRALSLRMWRR